MSSMLIQKTTSHRWFFLLTCEVVFKINMDLSKHFLALKPSIVGNENDHVISRFSKQSMYIVKGVVPMIPPSQICIMWNAHQPRRRSNKKLKDKFCHDNVMGSWKGPKHLWRLWLLLVNRIMLWQIKSWNFEMYGYNNDSKVAKQNTWPTKRWNCFVNKRNSQLATPIGACTF